MPPTTSNGDKPMARKLVVDVDTGVDDAQAVMMAVAHPEAEVLAVTCVAGNMPVDQVCINTLRVLRQCGRLDIPVFRGSPIPMNGIPYGEPPTYHHGADGMGGVPDDDPPSMDLIQEEHAAMAIVRLANEYPGEVTVVTLAPLTNLALAIRYDPNLGEKLDRVVVMGGNIEGFGNLNICTEFNFGCDPEAASMVLNELNCPIQLISYETCGYNPLTWEFHDKLMAVETPKGQFHRAINTFTNNRKKAIKRLPTYVSCDPTAMAVALDSSMVQKSMNEYCAVELRGEFTRGLMVIDRRKFLKREPNVEIVTKVDTSKLENFFLKMVE